MCRLLTHEELDDSNVVTAFDLEVRNMVLCLYGNPQMRFVEIEVINSCFDFDKALHPPSGYWHHR